MIIPVLGGERAAQVGLGPGTVAWEPVFGVVGTGPWLLGPGTQVYVEYVGYRVMAGAPMFANAFGLPTSRPIEGRLIGRVTSEGLPDGLAVIEVSRWRPGRTVSRRRRT